MDKQAVIENFLAWLRAKYGTTEIRSFSLDSWADQFFNYADSVGLSEDDLDRLDPDVAIYESARAIFMLDTERAIPPPRPWRYSEIKGRCHAICQCIDSGDLVGADLMLATAMDNGVTRITLVGLIGRDRLAKGGWLGSKPSTIQVERTDSGPGPYQIVAGMTALSGLAAADLLAIRGKIDGLIGEGGSDV